MKQKKKLLSMVLCIIMLLTQFQCVYAGEALSDTAASVTESGGVSETSSGTDSTKTDGGTDVVSGSGESKETGGKIDVSQETDSRTETKSEIDAGKTPDTSTEIKPETDAGKTQETSTETKTGTDAGKTQETSTETKTGTDAGKTQDTSTETKPGADAGTVPDGNTEDSGTTQPAIETTQPAIETTQPAIETTQPAIETTQPAIETTSEPAIEVEIPLGPWDGVTTTAAISKDNVYQIGTASQLAWFMVESNGKDLNAVLTTDIDLNNREWIFMTSEGYGGNFDGQGHTIKGFRIGTEEKPAEGNYKSLFGYLSGSGKIQNLKIVGEMHLLNCDYVGAFAGKVNNANFINCINQVNITMNGEGNNLGGIVGYINNGGTIEGCRNEGKLSGCNNVGGLVGSNNWWDTVIMISCINNGTISGKDCVGGLAGNFTKGEIKNSFATGSVNGDGSFGGLVGYRYKSIQSSFYYNQATPLKIAGSKDGEISNCYYLEAQNGDYGKSIGGISKNEKAFSGYEVLYFLNGCELHDTVWSQGKLYPELGNVAQKVYCISFFPYAIKSTVTVKINNDSNQFNIITNSAGIQSLYVKSGSRVTFTLSDENGEEILIKPMPQECSLIDGTYIINVLDKNVKIVYGTKDEFSKPTISWYDPNFSTYNISTEEELLGIQPLLLGETPYGKVDLSNKTILLSNDINLTKEWIPIGTSESSFNGIFDVQGHSINGLLIGSKEKPVAGGYQGFFANNSGTIQNLTISGNIYSIGDYIGGIAAYNTGSIKNCTFGSKGTTSTISGNLYVGGISGYDKNNDSENLINYGDIKGNGYVGGLFGKEDAYLCSGTNVNHGSVSNTGEYTGGIAGYSSESLSNSNNEGKVNGLGKYTGGVVGYANSRVSNIENKGTVTGMEYTGGICGYSNREISKTKNSGTISGSGYTGGITGYVVDSISGGTNTGAVSGNGDYVGGIAGYSKSNIQGSQFKADVNGVNYVGGIAGYVSKGITGDEENNAVVGKITGKEYVGGAAGYAKGNIDKISFATGSVVLGSSIVGGIAGELNGSITHSYVNGDAKGETSVGAFIGMCREKASIENAFYYNSKIKNSLVGTGNCNLDQVYFLSDVQTDNGGRTATQFASGEVAWYLDGGLITNSKTAWTQEKGTGYPILGRNPLYRIQVALTGAAIEGNSLLLGAGSVDQAMSKELTQWAYVKNGDLLNLNMNLLDNYDVTFIPALDLKYNETDKVYQLAVSGNQDITYKFTVSIPASYEWYDNAMNDENGKKIYNITSESDLKGLSNLVNGKDNLRSKKSQPISFKDETVHLVNDIDIESGNWPPIGTDTTPFSGNFDGDNHIIKDLQISSLSDYQGLFGYVSGAAIKNLTVSGHITNTGECTGGVAGCAVGNCSFENLIWDQEGFLIGGGESTGGIVGKVEVAGSDKNTVSFEACQNKGKVESNGNYVGGVIGSVGEDIEVTLKNCINSGTIHAQESVGGIAGNGSAMSAIYCYNMGTVKGQSNVGGISGEDGNIFENCYNAQNGKVEGSNENVGGVVGKQSCKLDVKGCYNSGTVKGGNNAGGITGNVSTSWRVKNASLIGNYNTGNVIGTDNVGGIIGISTLKNFRHNYNTGEVHATGSPVGGLIGKVNASGVNIEACYNTGKVSSSGKGAAAGGITGENHADEIGCVIQTFKTDSMVTGSYNTGTVTASKGFAGTITGRYYDLNTACYGLQNTGCDKKYVKDITNNQINSGELAYLLDHGDSDNRTTNWSYDNGKTVFVDSNHQSIFKLTINVSGPGVLKDAEAQTIEKLTNKYIMQGNSINFKVQPEAGSFMRLISSVSIFNENGEVSLIMPGNDVTLTAVFSSEEIPTGSFIASFDANGGQFADKTTVINEIIRPGETVKLPENPTKDGYTFNGWYTLKSGGVQITGNETLTADVIYFAQWTKVEGTFEIGDGSVENPYIISSEADLYLMAEKINGQKSSIEYADKCYEIKEGIKELNIESDWESIGTNQNIFKGSFDGRNAVIHLSSKTGLFGYVANANIRNLTVEADIAGTAMIGAVVNFVTGSGGRKITTFENIIVTGNILGTYSIGGLLGGTDSNRPDSSGGKDLIIMKNCRNEAEVYNTGGYTGGLAGSIYADFELADCVNIGKVTGAGKANGGWVEYSYVGGLIGWFNIGTVERCYNLGDITGIDGVGGLLGNSSYNSKSKQRSIRDSYNLGSVTAESVVGGIAGAYTNGMEDNRQYCIENCYNFGKISGNSKVGAISSDISLQEKCVNCYSLKDAVSSKDDEIQDEEIVTFLTQDQFAAGKAAYMLDGGAEPHRNVWTQRADQGYPILGSPTIYSTNVSGNKGVYSTTINGTVGSIASQNGVKSAAYSGNNCPVSVSVNGGSEQVTVDGKKYNRTYKLNSIAVIQNGTKTDITGKKTFVLTGDGANILVDVSYSDQLISEPITEGGGRSPGSKNKNNGGNGDGSGDKGNGQGMGQGSEGTETGQGDGTGKASGNQEGNSDILGDSLGGEKESNYVSTTITPTTSSPDNTESVDIAPMIEQEQQNDTDEDNESVEAANSGGLEEGIKAGEAEQDDEEDEQITVWEIVKQKVKDNPMMLVFVCLVIAAIVGMGGLARLKKSKRL